MESRQPALICPRTRTTEVRGTHCCCLVTVVKILGVGESSTTSSGFRLVPKVLQNGRQDRAGTVVEVQYVHVLYLLVLYAFIVRDGVGQSFLCAGGDSDKCQRVPPPSNIA
jgi:hypothetical protein